MNARPNIKMPAEASAAPNARKPLIDGGPCKGLWAAQP